MDLSALDLFNVVGMAVILAAIAGLLLLLVRYLAKGNDGKRRDDDLGT